MMRRFQLMLLLALLWTPAVAGRAYKAVAYLKNPEAVGASLPFVEVYRLRINQEEKIVVGNQSRYARRAYERLAQVDLDKLQSLEWSWAPGTMRLIMLDGSRTECHCYPAKVRNLRDDSMVESSLMQTVQVSGEFVLLGRRVKKQIVLSDVQKILFVDESEPLDGAAFRWAREENTAEGWEKFSQAFPQSARVPGARDNLVRVLLDASEREWKKYQSGGGLADLARARDIADKVLKVRADEPRALEIRKQSAEAESQVRAQVDQFEAAVKQQQWDEALRLHRAIARFSGEIPKIAELETRAARGSHEQHDQLARAHLKAGRLEEAIKEYQAALDRLPEKETQAELRECHVQLALRDAERARGLKQFEQADRLLEICLQQHGAESRVEQLRGQVRALWADQLAYEAKPLYAAVKVVADAVTESRHRNALELLEKANKLAPRAETERAIGEVRRRLASYYFQQGQKKLGLARGAGMAQASLYLSGAESFDNQLPGLAEALDKAREGFRRKSSIGVNVAFSDKSLRKACGQIAAEIEGSVGAEVTNARLPNAQVVEREEFERLAKEKDISGLAMNVQGATVQVLGDIVVCEAKARQTTNSVPSRYISGYRQNDEYFRLAQLRDQYARQAEAVDRQDDAYKNCAEQEQKAGVYGRCRQFRDQSRVEFNRLNSLEADAERMLQNMPQQFPILSSYSYMRRNITVDVRLKVGYRIVDSLSGVRREQEQLSEEDTKSGVEISGTMPQDVSNARDQQPNVPGEEELLEQLVGKLRKKIADAAIAFLRTVPGKYLERARQARDRKALDEAVENYILFLATTPQRSGRDFQEAEQFVLRERNLVYRAEAQ